MIFLWRHGIYLIEMLWLEELAAAAQPTFLFVVARSRSSAAPAARSTRWRCCKYAVSRHCE